MTTTLRSATWPQIQTLRAELEQQLANASSVVGAAQLFAAKLRTTFDTIALARVFLVAPYEKLPVVEREWVAARGTGPLGPRTPMLCLVGTAGAAPAWNDRCASAGHRVIALADPAAVERAPMLAALLASLRVELTLSAGADAVELRQMPGGINSRFYVGEAADTRDSQGRHIIAARDFVEANGIRTVFGMGGSYVGGALAAAIFFTRESLTVAEVDRYASLIGSFKLATARLVESDSLF